MMWTDGYYSFIIILGNSKIVETSNNEIFNEASKNSCSSNYHYNEISLAFSKIHVGGNRNELCLALA